MTFLVVPWFFVLVAFVTGQQGGLVKPCKMADIDCLRQSTTAFLNATTGGIPSYNILPIDPVVIPHIHADVKEHGISYDFVNMTVSGLKNLYVKDFVMNTETKTVKLVTEVDLTTASAVTAVYSKPKPKSYEGSLTGHGKAVVTTTYAYDVKKNEKGMEYFEVGSEDIECQATEASVVVGEELQKKFDEDKDLVDIRKIYNEEKRNESAKVEFCRLLKQIYPRVIHNLRTVAKLIPKTDFFSDL